MQNLLKEKGYKLTPARLEILNIFSKSNTPMNAEMICDKLKKNKKNNINEATVYRTLETLEKSEVLKRLDLRKESVYFELKKNHHHHIVCTKCNSIEDFENQEVEKALRRVVEKSSNFNQINEHSLELFGLCKTCFQ